MESTLENLKQLVMRAENRMTLTGIPRVVMVRGEIPEHQLAGVYEPMINLVLQGGKTISIGDQTLHYDPENYFVMSVDVPASGMVTRTEISLDLFVSKILGMISVFQKPYIYS